MKIKNILASLLSTCFTMDTNPSGSDGADWPFWMGQNGDTRPDCAAMLSCIYDFSDWTPPTGRLLTDPDYVEFGMQNFVQTLDQSVLKTWSPISLLPDAIVAGFKPLFMITSYGDHPTAYHQLVTMVCALRDADVPETSYQTLVIEGSEHSFGYWGSEGSQADKTVGDDVIAFLDAHLK